MNFYKQAALALDHLDSKQGSVKGSLSAAGLSGSEKEGKRVLALVIETLKYRPTLLAVSKSINLLHTERRTFPAKPPSGAPSSKNLTLVLLHDLLFSREAKIQASDKWPPKAALMRHATRVKAELVKLQVRKGLGKKEELERDGGSVAASIPRYARCNTNVTDLKSLLSRLTDPSECTPAFKLSSTAIYPPPPSTFFLDPHLPEVLLAFPTATRFENNEDYLNGGLVLQDKASCFPAKVLMYGWEDGEGEVLDATAAPGNKTSYLSALMGNTGKLHAFERSHNRFKTLQKMLAKAACKNVDPVRADFLDSDPEAYGGVTRILLDPSCSGSGIVNRLDYLLEDGESEDDNQKQERLDKLATFQLQMIQHAMKYPSVKRIVYSTCSIHKEEDEDVVTQALKTVEARAGRWKLAPRAEVLPTWERRGLPDHMDSPESADAVIRCSPGEDHTNGFFVSCFVKAGHTLGKRRMADESNDMTAETSAKRSKLTETRAGSNEDDSNDGHEQGDGRQLTTDVVKGPITTGRTQKKKKKKKKKSTAT